MDYVSKKNLLEALCDPILRLFQALPHKQEVRRKKYNKQQVVTMANKL